MKFTPYFKLLTYHNFGLGGLFDPWALVDLVIRRRVRYKWSGGKRTESAMLISGMELMGRS